MADQRRVGHAIRRRMGASSSHLGQAGGPGGSWSPPYHDTGEAALAAGEGVAQGISEVPIAGGRYVGKPSHLKGVPDTYETGTDTYGYGSKPPLGDSSAFVAGVASGVQAEPHPARGRIESSGSRLTVSPSMKVPTESPVPTQGGGRPVPSSSSRQGSFSQGQAGAYSG